MSTDEPNDGHNIDRPTGRSFDAGRLYDNPLDREIDPRNRGLVLAILRESEEALRILEQVFANVNMNASQARLRAVRYDVLAAIWLVGELIACPGLNMKHR